MGSHIKELACESIVSILEYLSAADLVNISEVSKSVFLKSHIRSAVIYQLDHVYPTSWRSPIKLTQDSQSIYGESDGSHSNGCDALFVCEVKTILFALSSPAPTNGKGYWISTTWVANARKHYLSLNLPILNSVRKKFSSKKTTKIRCRNTSSVPAPGSVMNSDITCSHNDLTGSNCTRLKKRIMDRQSWLFLRRFFPHGPEYKFSEVKECRLCLEDDEALKVSASLKQIEKLRPRQSEYLTGPLASLAARKNGVPSHLLTQKMAPGKYITSCEKKQHILSVSYCILLIVQRLILCFHSISFRVRLGRASFSFLYRKHRYCRNKHNATRFTKSFSPSSAWSL